MRMATRRAANVGRAAWMGRWMVFVRKYLSTPIAEKDQLLVSAEWPDRCCGGWRWIIRNSKKKGEQGQISHIVLCEEVTVLHFPVL